MTGSAAAAATPGGAQTGVGNLYVHLPFCRSRCAYCDFASEPLRPAESAATARRYRERLHEELLARRGLLAPQVETVYVGGGTPTFFPRGPLLDLLAELGDLLVPGGEFTVEANPGTVDLGLLEQLAQTGVTRISMGVQSFRSAFRRTLGRAVSGRQIEEALGAMRAAAWQDWNLDLIFGIPGQNMPAVLADLEAATAARPPHLSLYDLTYTRDYAVRVAHRLGPDARARAAEFAEDHYQEAVERLQAEGYRRYEVSNFARAGHECRHNLACWRGRDYVGLGASAVSTVGEERWANPCSVDAYLAREGPTLEHLGGETKAVERAMLGLRTAEGVPWAEVSDVVDLAALEPLEAAGFASRRCGTLFLSPRGLNVSNAVLTAILRLRDTLDHSDGPVTS